MAVSQLRTAEPFARCNHGAIGFGANLFVWAGVGGRGSSVPSSVLERFNVVSTCWQDRGREGVHNL